jgi:16S rRNA (guanine527-N7)-methyltransferase
MVPRHLLDSLAVMPYVAGMRIIDVGSGAGIPGIPLALALPDREFVLLDSNGKKSRFQTQVKAALGLQNVEVVNRRVEDYRPDRLFDTVITRAFASVTDILSSSRHLLASGGEMLAMKGVLPESELETLPHGFQLAETINIKVPGLEQEQRHLLRFRAVEP